MKKKPNPKPTIEDACIICGDPYAELHEVYYGNPYSRLSQEHKAQERLCHIHHRSQPQGVHGGNIKLDLELKRKHQVRLEKEMTREQFIQIFGRSYL